MGTPTNYLIAASVCLAFAYLIYLLIFRKETNFRQRRFFLIFAAVFSLLLPTGSYYILLPLTTKAETQTQLLTPSPVLESPVPHVATPDFYPVNPVTLPDTEPVKKKRSIDLLQALQFLYIAGVIVLLLRFIVQLVTIRIWYSRSRKVKQPLFTLLFHERFSTPFSFFNWIFLTEKRLPETDFEKIIAHESVHIKQKHSFDALFFELLCIFMWFNPFVWMMRRSINLTHEFLADEGAIQSGIDSLHYQALMVNQVAEANIVSVTSHFNKSLLSQRIKMIANSRLYKKTKYKILMLAPVALVLFLFIAGVNGLDKRKVLYRNLKKDAVISKVFSKDEIKDLVELRLMTDEMVVNVTGDPDTKLAYQKFNELLSGKETVSEVKKRITLSHDSLVTVVKSHPALLEIYDVSNSNNMSFSINRHGKVMEFLQELSKQNRVYKDVHDRIEIAGDISPSNISSFIKEPEKYNMESEAERLYASIIYGILTNRILKRRETGDIHKLLDRNNSPVLRAKNTTIKEKDNPQGTENEKRNNDSGDVEVIIQVKDNYSTDFMSGLYNLPEEYKKIEVRGSYLILNDTIFETLPDFLFSGKTYKMEGTDGNVKVKLSFTQNTYSSIDYVVQVSQNGEPEKQFVGVAELQASFFLGGKTETDNEKNEAFTTLQLIDNNKTLPLIINMGKDGLFDLRCRIENDDFKSPVLRSKNNEIPNQPPLSKNHIGDLRKMDVQTLFARLRFKPTVDFMPDPDEEKFIVYGETYGNDLISGIRLDVRNWLSYDDLKFLMSNLESQEPCKSMMSVFSSWRPDVESTIGGFAALFLDYYRKNQLFHPLVADPTNNPYLVKELKEWWENYNNENTRK